MFPLGNQYNRDVVLKTVALVSLVLETVFYDHGLGLDSAVLGLGLGLDSADVGLGLKDRSPTCFEIEFDCATGCTGR